MGVVVGATIRLAWVFFWYQFPTSDECSTHARYIYMYIGRGSGSGGGDRIAVQFSVFYFG